ncbi:AGAP007153-PA [Anopheles gambiae str. PEST]|uniref:AGAP007153-PA n=1 Tax=Anopheles gambiae TaxID=7165 RepID=A7URP5_ANOGA|nr:AGAP007153-PA [Anopheles gambiae str. PEST]
MFAKLFIVALAVVCASADIGLLKGRSLDFPVAYSAEVVPSVAYSAPVASYSTYSGSPLAYSAPTLGSNFYYHGRTVVV